MKLCVWLTGVLFPILSVVPDGNATFIEVPASLNVSLGSTAIFYCKVHGLAIVWLTDGVSAVLRSSQGVSYQNTYGHSNRIQSTLNVLATVENNNTKIVCKVLKNNGAINSEPAVLKVQGILRAPNGLQANYQKTTSSIEVNWDKPFTIDITTTEPDIQKYTVYTTNVNTGTETPVNVTGTAYVFTEASPDPCHIYEFSVSAWNMVGEGERSDKVTAYFILAPPQIDHEHLKATVTFRSNAPRIELTVQMPTIACIGEKVERLTIKAWSIQQRAGQQRVSTSETEETVATVDLTLELPSDDTYTLVVIPENTEGGLTPTGYIKLSTFDVQAAYISISNVGEVCITCYFARGSAAVGCYTVLHTPEGHTVDNFTAIRNSSTAKSCHSTADLVYEVYTCKVFDVEHTGEIGKRPAYTMEKVPVTSLIPDGPKPCACVNASTSAMRVDVDVTQLPASPDNYPEESSNCNSTQEEYTAMEDKVYIILLSVGTVILVLLVIAVLAAVVLAVLHKCRPNKRKDFKPPKQKQIVMRSNAAYEGCTITRNR